MPRNIDDDRLQDGSKAKAAVAGLLAGAGFAKATGAAQASGPISGLETLQGGIAEPSLQTIAGPGTTIKTSGGRRLQFSPVISNGQLIVSATTL